LLFDTGLAQIDARERRAYAAKEFGTGQRLLAQGHVGDAIDHLRSASSLDAENPAYGTELAQAMLADGRPADAEQLLRPLLERVPSDGATNLAMARVLLKEQRVDEAKSYYHRAIYGLWPSNAADRRTAARFELIDVLARTDARQELLAELLPMQEDSSNDVAMRKRIAHLFVVAGSPTRAVSTYRELLRRNPRDGDAYLGLAEAALSTGNFSTARADLVAASRLLPGDSSIIARMVLIDSVIAIDPTQRGLSLGEQSRRTRNLLQMTMTSLRSCLRAEAPEVRVALDSAAAMLVAPALAPSQGQTIEANLSLAEQLWGLRRTRCATDGVDEALALVQDRLAQ
jgi:tetratricopeptide (TPR) repeat protein